MVEITNEMVRVLTHDFLTKGGITPREAIRRIFALSDVEAKLETANALVTCCCGDPVDAHNMGSGHGPVDQYHYAMRRLEEENAKLKAAYLCQDEGCPQHGTDHVCVDRTSERAAFRAGFDTGLGIPSYIKRFDKVDMQKQVDLNWAEYVKGKSL